MRIRVMEDDPETTELARQILESHRSARFVVEFVTSSQQLRDELARTAFREESIGAHSRAFLLESLSLEAIRARRFGRDLSCLVLDLDDFHVIGDVGGGSLGDETLKSVAGLLRQLVRAVDLVAYHGEDEFCILLIETALDDAANVAERIRFGIAGQVVPTDGEPLSMTVSIGVSSLASGVDEPPEAVLDRAEAALKDAKRAGKNRVCVHAATNHSQAENDG